MLSSLNPSPIGPVYSQYIPFPLPKLPLKRDGITFANRKNKSFSIFKHFIHIKPKILWKGPLYGHQTEYPGRR